MKNLDSIPRSSFRVYAMNFSKLFLSQKSWPACVGVAVALMLMQHAAPSAIAQVTVNTVILNFKSGQRPVQSVMVGNSSDHPAYVLARVEKVMDPESGGNISEPSDDILVSPKAFSLEPKGQRAIRLLLRKPPQDVEAVYRALFVPQDRGFGQEIKREYQGRKASIRVLTGMGVLLFVEPKNPTRLVKWSREADAITFLNEGNIHLELADGKSCELSGEECVGLESKRVYAGTSFSIPATASRTLSFLTRFGADAEFEQITIDASSSGQIAR
jgi:P pilus assembly chaperone PapD